MANSKMIVGINAELVSEDTGVPAHFHVISAMNVDFANQSTYLTLASYYSQKLHDAGKNAVGTLVYTLDAAPPRGEDVMNWVYAQLVAPVAEGETDRYGNPKTTHALTGGELVGQKTA